MINQAGFSMASKTKTTSFAVFILLFGTLGGVMFFALPDDTPRPKIVGVLQFTRVNQPTLEGFKQGMVDQGYRDASAIHYVFHGPVPVRGELEGAMLRLLDAKPDLIFASPTPAAIVAKKLTKGTGTPVIFAPVNDPVSAGIVLTPSEPEANVTGVRLSPSDGRRLQSLTEIVPDVHRVFVPYSPEDKSAAASLSQLRPAAGALGVELVTKEFWADTDPVLDPGYIPPDVDAVLLPREGRVMSRIHDFVTVCNDRKLPLSTPRYWQVEAGAALGYGFMGYELGRQAARQAHLALTGTPIASIPVESSRDYLFVNLKTAKTIGLHMDDAVLRRAHRIIR